MDKRHFQTSSAREYHHYNRHFVDSLDSTLDGIIAMSGSEMETDVIFGELMKLCQQWCEANNKKIYVMSPSQLHHCKYPNEEYPHVEHVEWHGYDMMLYDDTPMYRESKNKLIRTLEIGGIRYPNKLFVCYNNRRDTHRTMLVDQLEVHDLLKKGIVTYKNYRPDLIDEADFELHTPPAIPEYGIDQFPRNYFKGLLDIVTESRWKPGEHYMSEKTFKPIVGLKPFLVLSAQGYHTWLERKGIKKYNIFDYSFDNEPKLEDRVEGIIQNLKRLDDLYKTPEDYANVLKELEPAMQDNIDTVMSNIKSGKFLLHPILEHIKLIDIGIDSPFTTQISGEGNQFYHFLHSVIV